MIRIRSQKCLVGAWQGGLGRFSVIQRQRKDTAAQLRKRENIFKKCGLIWKRATLVASGYLFFWRDLIQQVSRTAYSNSRCVSTLVCLSEGGIELQTGAVDKPDWCVSSVYSRSRGWRDAWSTDSPSEEQSHRSSSAIARSAVERSHTMQNSTQHTCGLIDTEKFAMIW